MSTLYLTCGLCGRKQADGILSRGAWGHLDDDAGGGSLRACPSCKTAHSDWESQLTAGQNGRGASMDRTTYGISA